MPTDNPLVNWLVGIVIALVALVWFDLRRQAKERHTENVTRLNTLAIKMDNVNTTIAKHAAVLEFHSREIERLRGGR
jgi:hypothetical protein